MQLLRASKAPQAVAAALDDAVWRPYLALPCAPHARAYYRAVAGDSLNDCSFILQEADRVLAAVICDAADGALAQFGFPIEPLLRAGLSHAVRKDIAVQTLAELRRIARERDARTVKVRSAARNDADGLLLGLLAEEGASTEVELRAEVDLRSGEEALLADLRASYRRHLRWAEENMRMAGVDAQRPDRAAFEAFRALHAEVAGRVTRGAASWEQMYRNLEAGLADLVLGYWRDALVAGTYVLDCADTTYYATGVYRRELFEHPLSHGTMFEAIRRARQRGRAAFDVGELPGRDSGASEKEIAIGHFKRGFSAVTRSSVVLNWTPA